MAELPEVFDALAHSAASNLQVALDLAGSGVSVFPCQPGGDKVKCPYPGLLWRHASTTDDGQVKAWWSQWPDALPAIDLGKSGFLVVDCDKAKGIADWRAIAAGRAVDAPDVHTPNAGLHVYYRQPAQAFSNGRGSLPAKDEHGGIDVRGMGGYVIAPGATLLDGRQYEYDGHVLDFLRASVVPAWLAEILRSKRAVEDHATPVEPGPPVSDARKRAYGERALADEIRALSDAPAGSRNETANRVAFSVGQLVGGGCLTHREAYSALHGAALTWGISSRDKCLGPIGTIARALRDGAGSPRGPREDELGEQVGDLDLPAPRTVIEHADGTLTTEDGEVIEAPVVAEPAAPPDLMNPPGLVGRLADWICDSARLPQREMAIGAALTIVGTLIGRQIKGPTGLGTHLYVVALAESGFGKEHVLGSIMTALTSVECEDWVGPSQFISMPAVVKFLQRRPVSACAVDEFGSFLKRVNNRKAQGFEAAISGMLRSIWGQSFRVTATPEWANLESTLLKAPALSIFGCSTADDFYEALGSGDTSNGFLNRMLVVTAGSRRPKARRPLITSDAPPEALRTELYWLARRLGDIAFGQLQMAEIPPFDDVPWGPGAEEAWLQMESDFDDLCDRDPSARNFYVRSGDMAIRLATILAVGRNPNNPVVELSDFQWGRDFVMRCMDRLYLEGRERIADTDNQANANLVLRKIREAGGRVKHRDLLRSLNHRLEKRQLEGVLQLLVSAERVRVDEVKPEGGGPVSRFYELTRD